MYNACAAGLKAISSAASMLPHYHRATTATWRSTPAPESSPLRAPEAYDTSGRTPATEPHVPAAFPPLFRRARRQPGERRSRGSQEDCTGTLASPWIFVRELSPQGLESSSIGLVETDEASRTTSARECTARAEAGMPAAE